MKIRYRCRLVAIRKHTRGQLADMLWTAVEKANAARVTQEHLAVELLVEAVQAGQAARQTAA